MDIEMRLMMGFQEYIYAAVTIFCGPELQPRVGLKQHKLKWRFQKYSTVGRCYIENMT